MPQSGHDFGRVQRGTVVPVRFSVRNLHPWSVRITGIRGGCGCARPVIDRPLPVELKPFESATINAPIDTNMKTGFIKVPIEVVIERERLAARFMVSGVIDPT